MDSELKMNPFSLYNLGLGGLGSEVTERLIRGGNCKSETSFGAISQNHVKMFQPLPTTDLSCPHNQCVGRTGREPSKCCTNVPFA